MSTIEELRTHLFGTLQALRDPENPMDIARAKAVADVAQTVINTAKVEVEAMRVTGAKHGSGFLPGIGRTIEGEPADPHNQGRARSPQERERQLRDMRRSRV